MVARSPRRLAAGALVWLALVGLWALPAATAAPGVNCTAGTTLTYRVTAHDPARCPTPGLALNTTRVVRVTNVTQAPGPATNTTIALAETVGDRTIDLTYNVTWSPADLACYFVPAAAFQFFYSLDNAFVLDMEPTGYAINYSNPEALQVARDTPPYQVTYTYNAHGVLVEELWTKDAEIVLIWTKDANQTYPGGELLLLGLMVSGFVAFGLRLGHRLEQRRNNRRRRPPREGRLHWGRRRRISARPLPR